MTKLPRNARIAGFLKATLAALIGLCGISLTTAIASQPPLTIPTTPVGVMAKEYLSLCSAPSLDRFTRWLVKNISLPNAAAAVPIAHENLDFCTAHGGLILKEIVESKPQKLTLRAEGIKSHAWVELWWTTDEHGQLNGGDKGPVVPREDTVAADLSDSGIARSLQQVVMREAQAGLFSGIVVVGRGRAVLVNVSGGFANRKDRTPITTSTQFTLGSMGKLFTTVAVGQLMDEGKLSLSDTVGHFFPDYPNQTVRAKVTVGMLLSHTSGLGDFITKRPASLMASGVSRAADYMFLFDRDEPKFEPGTQWSYSNAGLGLAGAIVEKVSGEDFPSYLKRHIFDAAGMAHSDPNNVPHTDPALVTPYTKEAPQGPVADWIEAPHDIGSPAGGEISTAYDLLQFADALRTGKLLSAETLRTLTQPNPFSAPDDRYGYGFRLGNIYGRPTIGHEGGIAGVSTSLKLFLDSSYTVVVLSNFDSPSVYYPQTSALALIAERLKRKQ